MSEKTDTKWIPQWARMVAKQEAASLKNRFGRGFYALLSEQARDALIAERVYYVLLSNMEREEAHAAPAVLAQAARALQAEITRVVSEA